MLSGGRGPILLLRFGQSGFAIDRQRIGVADALGVIEHRDELALSTHQGCLGSFRQFEVREVRVPSHEQTPSILALLQVRYFGRIGAGKDSPGVAEVNGLLADGHGNAIIVLDVGELLA